MSKWNKSIEMEWNTFKIMEFMKVYKIMYKMYKITITSNYYNFFLTPPFSSFIQFIFSTFILIPMLINFMLFHSQN